MVDQDEVSVAEMVRVVNRVALEALEGGMGGKV